MMGIAMDMLVDILSTLGIAIKEVKRGLISKLTPRWFTIFDQNSIQRGI